MTWHPSFERCVRVESIQSVSRRIVAVCASLSLLGPVLAESADAARAAPVSKRGGAPVFKPAGNGGYSFDTGTLSGKLHVDGKALGLTDVRHKPSGRALAGPYGLCSLYRVFSRNHRYGTATWDWPSTSRLMPDGAVEVRWTAETDRPFALSAVYRWHDAAMLDVEIAVEPRRELKGFEVFLASYFDPAFTDPLVHVGRHPARGDQSGLMLARKEAGNWQMFPRDDEAVPLIQDGRWRIDPNPVDWVIQPRLDGAWAVRRDPVSGLVGVLMAPRADCFAIATPYAGETHNSLYLSLFGQDLRAGQARTVRARLFVDAELKEGEVADRYADWP